MRKDHPTGPERDRLLYRGESSVYPHTHSLIFRIIHEQQLVPTNQVQYLIDTLDEIHCKLNMVINDIPVFSTPEAALAACANVTQSDPIEILGAFLQHYYLPTPLLDVTSDLDIAAHFAAYPVEGVPESQPNLGQFYVFNVEELRKAGRKVFSLEKSKALRPSTQKAYSLFLRGGEDLHNPDHFPYPQVDRYTFLSTNTERARFFKPGLMIAQGDRVAREVGACCGQVLGRDWATANPDRRRVLVFLNGVLENLIKDRAHLP